MTIASLFRNLLAITALVYAYFALDVDPDPRQWRWWSWALLGFWYVLLVSVYWEKNAKSRHGTKGT
ncbi:hypothetical protein [Pseudomonas sivasensis]|uniref:hypothetical protein n=1 Tax=Pseudomonas sivasensis TaxID=1880678 RepID=UPI003BA15CBE